MLTTLPLALQLRQHARPYGYPGVVAQRSTSVTLPVLLQRVAWMGSLRNPGIRGFDDPYLATV